MHGRPRKLSGKSPSHTTVKKLKHPPPTLSHTRVYENSNKSIVSGFTGDIRCHSTNEAPLSKVITGIISDILDNVIEGTTEATVKPVDENTQNESDCSLDHSLFTDTFGDPALENLN